MDKRLPKRHGVISFLKQYLRLLRFYLMTGLMVWIPLIVTVWLTWWLFKNVALNVESLIEGGYDLMYALGDRVPILGFLHNFEYRGGYGFLIAIALFLTTGFFTRYLVGRRFIGAGERIFNRIPLVSRVYRSVQQIRDVFVNRGGAVFHSVCIVEYPRKGIWCVAFVTSEEQGAVQIAINKELISIFLPTTPNPTSGFLLYLPRKDIIALDVSVEDAMKLIISGGAYIPPTQDIEEPEEIPEQLSV